MTIIFRLRMKNNVWSSFSKHMEKNFLIFFDKKMVKKTLKKKTNLGFGFSILDYLWSSFSKKNRKKSFF